MAEKPSAGQQQGSEQVRPRLDLQRVRAIVLAALGRRSVQAPDPPAIPHADDVVIPPPLQLDSSSSSVPSDDELEFPVMYSYEGDVTIIDADLNIVTIK